MITHVHWLSIDFIYLFGHLVDIVMRIGFNMKVRDYTALLQYELKNNIESLFSIRFLPYPIIFLYKQFSNI